MALLLILLTVIILFLWIKNNQLARAAHTPKYIKHSSTPKDNLVSNLVEEIPRTTQAAKKENTASSKTRINKVYQSNPSLNTGISELDGPGMYQRLTSCGPEGHVLYLIYSPSHKAYKVGISRPEKLGNRVKMIRESVPDTRVLGTAIFTSRQNAFNKEQEVLDKYKAYKYSGMKGEYAGRTEWITRKPTGRLFFTPPDKVEISYLEKANAPLPNLEIPDIYTVYLAYSKTKDAYKAKWCKSENLDEKIKKLQRLEAPDAIVLARFKVEELHKAREITKKLHENDKTFIESGRRDIVEWSKNPTYLEKFKAWDAEGNRT